MVTGGLHVGSCKYSGDNDSNAYCSDAMVSAMASRITGVLIVHYTFCSGTNQRSIKAPRHWTFWGHKGPVTRKMVPYDDVAMNWAFAVRLCASHSSFTVEKYLDSLWRPSSQIWNIVANEAWWHLSINDRIILIMVFRIVEGVSHLLFKLRSMNAFPSGTCVIKMVLLNLWIFHVEI